MIIIRKGRIRYGKKDRIYFLGGDDRYSRVRDVVVINPIMCNLDGLMYIYLEGFIDLNLLHWLSTKTYSVNILIKDQNKYMKDCHVTGYENAGHYDDSGYPKIIVKLGWKTKKNLE